MKRETKLWKSIKSHNKFSLCEVWKSHKLKSKFCVSTAWNTFDNELSCQQCGHFHFCATSTAGILRMTNILCKQSKWNWKRSQEGQVTKAPDPLQNKSHPFDTFVKILLFFPFTFNNSLKSGDCGGRMTFFFKIKFFCWFLPKLLSYLICVQFEEKFAVLTHVKTKREFPFLLVVLSEFRPFFELVFWEDLKGIFSSAIVLVWLSSSFVHVHHYQTIVLVWLTALNQKFHFLTVITAFRFWGVHLIT